MSDIPTSMYPSAAPSTAPAAPAPSVAQVPPVVDARQALLAKMYPSATPPEPKPGPVIADQARSTDDERFHHGSRTTRTAARGNALPRS